MHLYFLTDGVVSRYELTAHGESANMRSRAGKA